MVMTFFFAILASHGCGGGGGGGGAVPAGVTYTGLTTQATITDTNAELLTTEAFEGGEPGTAIGVFAGVSSENNNAIHQSRLIRLTRILEGAMLQVDVASAAGDPVISAVQQASETIEGDPGMCASGPGSATFTISYDEGTGAFSGSMTFNNFCGGGDTVSGSASFSGQISPSTEEMLQFSFSFNNLLLSSETASITVSGTVSMDVQSLPVVATMELLIRDNISAEVYWVNNYTLQITPGAGNMELEISGRFYHPGHGFVILTTPEPLVLNVGDEWPSSGVFMVEGAIGPGGSFTTARLTALSSTTYLIEADTNGDGQFDDYSEEFFWR